MVLTIFGKKRTSKDGREFATYFTKLTKKTGEQVTATVKFREECGAPSLKECPMNIIVERDKANFNEKGITYEKDGVEHEAIERVLWVSAWTQGEPYIDESLDEFVD